MYNINAANKLKNSRRSESCHLASVSLPFPVNSHCTHRQVDTWVDPREVTECSPSPARSICDPRMHRRPTFSAIFFYLVTAFLFPYDQSAIGAHLEAVILLLAPAWPWLCGCVIEFSIRRWKGSPYLFTSSPEPIPSLPAHGLPWSHPNHCSRTQHQGRSAV